MNGESMNVAAENNVPMTKQESKVTLANKKKTIAQSQRSVVIALDDYKKAAKKLQKSRRSMRNFASFLPTDGNWF